MAKLSSPEDMAASMVANMKEKTGRTLPEWLKLAKPHKDEKHGVIVKWLKTEHGVTHGFANLIAHELRGGAVSVMNPGSGDDLLAAQYAGKKAGLSPIYQALLKAASKLGPDVVVAPKKTYVSLRRSKQFALIQPSTATRVDLGLNLKGHEVTDRLEASGSFNSMCTHRVRLSGPKDVDAAVLAWLKKAYAGA
ncbi:MAG: DUF4287 domain-containing protein [Planctomycetes bacterium]|nr:DUF4287 domain-containing protein [Planctomycetota bacterium]